MKIVIIARNCFPKLGPRSHRATELAKELARQGHEVVLYALLGNYNYMSFEKETKVKVKNLGISKFGISDNTEFSKRNYFYRAIRKFLGKYLEFPNIELVSMVKNALECENNIDYLITIASPHTIHWGASGFIKKNKGKVKFWVADCGDPFMKNPFHPHPFYFKNVEKKWGKLCNYITVPIKEAKKAYYPEFSGKIKVIPQGFSFRDIRLFDYTPNTIPTFAYSGIVYDGLRDPTEFLKYLSTLKSDFRFIVYTKSVSAFNQFKHRLGNKLEIRDYIPREELIYELSKMDFLINFKNKSGVQQPSKLIDYAISKRPILDIDTSFDQKDIFHEYLDANYSRGKVVHNIERFNIENVARSFIILKEEYSETVL